MHFNSYSLFFGEPLSFYIVENNFSFIIECYTVEERERNKNIYSEKK